MTHTIDDSIRNWCRKQSPALQDLARRVLSRGELDDVEREEVRRIFMAQGGALVNGESAPTAEPLDAVPPSTSASAHVPRLVSIARATGINALASDQTLPFARSGLTVIHGENGAGKTGYARILKATCHASVRGPAILENVFGTDAVVPAVEIAIDVDGVERSIAWQPDAGPIAELTGISVFDASCAEIYVSGKRDEIAYVPDRLRFFQRLAREMEGITALIRTEREALAAVAAVEIGPFSGTKHRGLFRAWPNVDLDRARDLAASSDTDDARAADLDRALADHRNREELAASDELLARNLDALAAKIQVASESLSNDVAAALQQAAKDVARAEALHQNSVDLLSARAVQLGLPIEPFAAMWKAAARLTSTPADLRACPLCEQELHEGVGDRLTASLVALAEASGSDVGTAARALDARRDQLLRVAIPGSRELDGLAADRPHLRESLEADIVALTTRRQALLEDGPATALPKLSVDALRARAAELRAGATTMRDSGDESRLVELYAERDELRDRRTLASQLPRILVARAAETRVETLKRVEKALDTKSATRKSSELANEVLTPRLQDAIKEELEHFGLAHLKLRYSAKGRRGATSLDVTLDTAQTRSAKGVLSEGECRGLALAIYLAEARVADLPGGLVLDDPMSSLDDERRRHVAERLTELAKDRQVILFTHDPVFVTELERAAGHAKCGITGALIERRGSQIGIVRPHRVWLLACRDFLRELRKDLGELARLEQLDNFDGWDGCAARIDRYLRWGWERAVEERLMNNTVTRYERQVRIKNFAKICRDAAVIAMVDKGLDEAAYPLHDQGPGRTRSAPPVSELERRVRDFETFLERCPPPR